MLGIFAIWGWNTYLARTQPQYSKARRWISSIGLHLLAMLIMGLMALTLETLTLELDAAWVFVVAAIYLGPWVLVVTSEDRRHVDTS